MTKPDPLPRHDLAEAETEGTGPERVHRLTNTFRGVGETEEKEEEEFYLPTHPPTHPIIVNFAVRVAQYSVGVRARPTK